MYIKRTQQTCAQLNEGSSLSYQIFRFSPISWHLFAFQHLYIFEALFLTL